MFGRKAPANRVDIEALERFFEALDRLDMEQLEALRTAWQAIPKDRHETAWANVRTVAERDGLTGDLDRVRARAIDWTKRGSIQPGRGLPDYRTWIQLKIGAAEAIVDAALAHALGDRLDAQTRETLLGPWIGARPGE
jgi:hypothetical protein